MNCINTQITGQTNNVSGRGLEWALPLERVRAGGGSSILVSVLLGLIVIISEVFAEDTVGLVVDLLVHVLLELLQQVEHARLLHLLLHRLQLVGSRSRHGSQQRVEHLQTVGEEVGVGVGEEAGHRLPRLLRDQLEDLRGRAALGEVGERPRALELAAVVARLHDLDDHAEQAVVEDCLNLLLGSCDHVRDEPAALLDDGRALRLARHRRQDAQRAQLDHRLRQRVVARRHVAEHSERGCHQSVVLAEVLEHVWHDARVARQHDLLVGSVREVGDGPARVLAHIVVLVLDQDEESLRQHLEHLEGRVRVLVAAHVREGPGERAHERGRQRTHLLAQDHQRLHAARLDDKVAELRRVAGDVGDGPRCPQGQRQVRVHHKLDQGCRRTRLHCLKRLLRGARDDVGERPGALVRDLLVLDAQALDECVDETAVDHLVHLWVLRLGQEAAHALEGVACLLHVRPVLEDLDHLLAREKGHPLRVGVLLAAAVVGRAAHVEAVLLVIVLDEIPPLHHEVVALLLAQLDGALGAAATHVLQLGKVLVLLQAGLLLFGVVGGGALSKHLVVHC
ncbi:hypothetical protein PENTCL1PPCAC_24088 [Pristionchus entomophagus]|uniref:Uncharacterized protein n=1 Tax=Pristionchus entomophagus TaxID=358040 RepID=A0AAV5U716_9BILA|nr:hypothetical protein PENTCL1PPCAC_24088 [Pristionchus entomophagus]